MCQNRGCIWGWKESLVERRVVFEEWKNHTFVRRRDEMGAIEWKIDEDRQYRNTENHEFQTKTSNIISGWKGQEVSWVKGSERMDCEFAVWLPSLGNFCGPGSDFLFDGRNEEGNKNSLWTPVKNLLGNWTNGWIRKLNSGLNVLTKPLQPIVGMLPKLAIRVNRLNAGFCI